MRFKILFYNIYWLIIGILSTIFIFVSNNPLILIFTLIVIFASSIYVGNIFVVKSTWRAKPIIILLVIFLLIFFLENILELKNISIVINSLFTSIISISIITTTLVKESGGMTIGLIVKNWRKMKIFFTKYLLHFNFGTILGWIVEIVLIISMINIFPNSITKWLMILFWMISGPLFVMLRATSFVLDEDIDDIITVAQIYGTARMTYFLLIFYHVGTIISWLEFSFLFSIVYFGFLNALLPYIFKSDELKNTLKIIKYLKIKNRMKVKNISNATGIMSKLETSEILYRLNFHNFVESMDHGKRWSLHRIYKKIIT